MKIAFVNQPIDTILPPYQSSVGACTYGAATAITKFCDVIAYGTTDKHKEYPPDLRTENVRFRFFPVPLSDRLRAIAAEKYRKIFPSSSPASSSKWLFQAFGRQVAEDLRSQGCDVIQVQQCAQYLSLIRALNPHAKIVLQLHAEWFSQNQPAILAERLRHVDLVTTVSDYITKKTRRQFPMIADRCRTMYNAVDATEFNRERTLDPSMPREKCILYAGAVSPHKGIHVLLDAFSIIVNQYPDVRLDIVGLQANYPLTENFELHDRELIDSIYPFYAYHWSSKLKAKLGLASHEAGSYMAHLQQRLPSKAKERVVFHGFVARPELVDLYYRADVFAFAPIWNEGFGIPPVEAMAAGVPVVASRSGAIPETVKDQETGYLVDKNDSDALAGGILKLLNDEDARVKMGRAARDWVHQKFTWDRVAQEMYTCYKELCGIDNPSITADWHSSNIHVAAAKRLATLP